MKKQIVILNIIFAMLICTSCGQQKGEDELKNKKPEASQMKTICELATMECYYHNVAKYEKKNAEGVWFWAKDRRFWVKYSGIVTIGIDASQLQMSVDDDVVTISIPEAKVLSSKVDPDSLNKDSFYIDADSADVDADSQTEAYKQAEKKMTQKASNDAALLSNAQQKAQSLLENYVNNIGSKIGKDYKIEWEYLDTATEEKE